MPITVAVYTVPRTPTREVIDSALRSCVRVVRVVCSFVRSYVCVRARGKKKRKMRGGVFVMIHVFCTQQKHQIKKQGSDRQQQCTQVLCWGWLVRSFLHRRASSGEKKQKMRGGIFVPPPPLSWSKNISSTTREGVFSFSLSLGQKTNHKT